MSTSEVLFKEMKSAPDLFLLLKKIQAEVKSETTKRKAFYQIIHDDSKAEFINGEILYQSPVTMRHWKVSSNLSGLIIPFVKQNKLGEVAVEKAMVSLTRNDYEPDICFWKSNKSKKFKSGTMHFPAPAFIVEILSLSTTKTDRGIKFRDYSAHGVEEYWIIDPKAEIIEQYWIEGSQYSLVKKAKKQDIVSSKVISGFEIKASEIFAK